MLPVTECINKHKVIQPDLAWLPLSAPSGVSDGSRLPSSPFICFSRSLLHTLVLLYYVHFLFYLIYQLPLQALGLII